MPLNIPAGGVYSHVREYNRGISPRDEPFRWIRLARILHVDNERATVDVRFLDGPGRMTEVPVSFGSAGQRHFVGSFPEVFDIVLVGWMTESTYAPRPVVIGCLGGGWKAALNWDPAQQEPFGGAALERPVRRKLVKIYPGQALLQSSQGSFVHAGDDLLAQAAAGLTWLLRSVDKHAILRALNLVKATGAGRFYSGPIIRNPLVLDPVGAELTDRFNITPHRLYDGRQIYYVSNAADRKTILEGAEPYVEDRGVLREHSDLIMDVFGDLDQAEVDAWLHESFDRNQRHLEWCRGTFVGDVVQDGEDEQDLYAKILRLKMFSDAFNELDFDFGTDGSFEYVAAEDNGNQEIFLSIADHFRLFSPLYHLTESTAPFIRDIDKSGTLYEIIGTSSSHNPIGQGVSVVRAIQGGIKEHLGKTVSHGNSPPEMLDAIAASHDVPIPSGISEFRSLDGALHVIIKGPDSQNDAYILEVKQGNAKILIAGDAEFHIEGSLQELIGGDVEKVFKGNVYERIEGAYKREINGDQFEQVAGTRTIGINEDDILHIGGGQSVLVRNGRQELIAALVPAVPALPPAPTEVGISRRADGTRTREPETADPNPGIGTGASPPTGGDSNTTFGGDMTRTYQQDLVESIVGNTNCIHTGTVDEQFASPVTRNYGATLSETIVGVYRMQSGSFYIQSAGPGAISAETALILRSSVSIAEQAPVVLRG